MLLPPQKDGSAYIIDVRSSKAQTKTGTLKGSISQSLFDDNNKLDTAEAEALEKAFIKRNSFKNNRRQTNLHYLQQWCKRGAESNSAS